MLDPITIATTILSIANVINQANKLLKALSAAPSEFKTLAAQVKSLAQVLASIRTDLIDDRDSIINRSKNLHTENNLDLDNLIKSCEKGVKRVNRLFNDYKGATSYGLWGRWGWTNEGKQEVRSSLSDLQSLTGLVSLFIQKEVAQGVGRLEHIAEEERRARQREERRRQREMRDIREALGIPEPHDPSKDITNLFATSIFASRWVGILRARKAPQQSGRVSKPASKPSSGRVRPGPTPNLTRKNSLRSGAYTTRTAVPEPTTNPSFKLKGWRVASGSYVIGPTIHKRVVLKRTQQELQDLVNLAQAGSKSIDRKHHAVKWLMGQLGSNSTWTFAGGRYEGGERFIIVCKKDIS